jgi:hypothetical protein
MKGAFTIKYGVFCDDARREDNGKIFLIGIYGSSILFEKFPASIQISAALFCDISLDANAEISVRMMLDDEQLTLANGIVSAEKSSDGIVLLPKIPITLAKEGALKLQLKFADEEWATIIQRPVTVMPKKPAKHSLPIAKPPRASRSPSAS